MHKNFSSTGTPFAQVSYLTFDVQARNVQVQFNGAKRGPAGRCFYFEITATTKAQHMLSKWRNHR